MIQRLNHINEICEELGKKKFFGKNVYFEQYKRNCVFVTNSNFLIPISLQLNGVNLDFLI